jgi:predicted RNA methylase
MLKTLSADDAKYLHDFLFESNYKQTEIRDGLSLRELPSKQLGNLPHLMHRTRERTRFSTLLRWFFVGAPVDVPTATELIPERALRILLDCGLLSISGDHFAPTVMLAPFEHLVVASDSLLTTENPEHSDLVLWPNPTTWLLWRFTIQKPFESVLDLGTGNGVLALMAARHCPHVKGSDLNTRALKFAEFNAWLNGVENVEFLAGDTYEPVGQNKFDLIVSNPPFFISPVHRDLFCDNPMELDQYCRRVVREGAQRLNEGGYLQLVCEWAQVKGQPWKERIAEWFEGAGCDAWVLKGYTEDPSQYAQKRIRETSGGQPLDDHGKTYGQWIDYYNKLNVEAIYGGVIALHRRSGTNWTRWDEITVSPKTPFGGTILRGFEGRDFVESHPGEGDLSGIKPKLSRDVRLEQLFELAESSWQSTSLRLVLTDGLPFSIGIQPLVAEFIAKCDGTRPLSELILELSAKVKASPEQVQRECVSVIRRLIERGFVTPESRS